MEIKIFDDYNALSQYAADEVINLVKQKPNAVICLASGNSPLGTCQWIVKKAASEKIDFSNCTFIGLDEWVGVSKKNNGSCHFFFYNNLFTPLHISDTRIFLFDAMAADLDEQCKKMDDLIVAKNGIDLMIVGIGMNGHIGFNEPGVSFDLLSHVINLEETTKTVGQKYFSEPMNLTQGITLGLVHLMNAKKAILLANGNNKSDVIRQAIKNPITESLPASILQKHKNSFIFLDKEAASLL
jgi:glucosamine-6-phosphate isomerase